MRLDRRSMMAGLIGSALCGPTGVSASSAEVIARHAPPGRFGFVLLDAETGAILDESGADDLFIPASLAKIPTSFAAMRIHGPEARFATGIRISGPVENGVLHGDLTLIGGGDPGLDTADLDALANRIAGYGIRHVAGAFRYYAGALPQSRWLDPNQPWQAPYNPSMSGLNLNYNRVQFKWSWRDGALAVRGAAVADGKVAPAPSIKFRIVGGSYAHGTVDGGEIWSIPQTTLRRNGHRWLPVRRPGLFAASVLRALCAGKGVTLPAPQAAPSIPDGADIATHRSAPVADMLRGMLRFSTNLTAEALGASVGNRRGLSPNDLEDAARLTAEFMRDEIGGSGWSGFSLANHSGLSVRSRATPRQIAQVLRAGRNRYGGRYVTLFNEKTLGRLPSGGFAPPHQIRSKTGTMHFVRGLAGYLRMGNRDTVFAFLANDDARRGALDAAFTPYADETPLGARGWLLQARTFEGMMIADWLNRYSA